MRRTPSVRIYYIVQACAGTVQWTMASKKKKNNTYNACCTLKNVSEKTVRNNNNNKNTFLVGEPLKNEDFGGV